MDSIFHGECFPRNKGNLRDIEIVHTFRYFYIVQKEHELPMSDLIKLLPENIANQIAAGEVVQRPSSVVKELLENAIDAGASSIRLIIKDAGKTLVQVIDDGSGMSPADAKLCFERHATSKIRQAKDLFEVSTKGFRGEALSSIAAVAQVELKTKQDVDELGTRIKIEASEIELEEPCQTIKGTSISVKNLFYNIPARRNFLKSNPVELKHITDEFIHVSLAHPDIAFTFYNNEECIYNLQAGNCKKRIISLFGKKMNSSLISVDETTDALQINGYIGTPEAARKTRGNQFFFVNDRFIKSGYLNHAITKAFEQLIPDKTYPFYAIYLYIDPKNIDINVHPTKQEIKFEDEKLVYNYLKVAVRHSLAQHNITPSIDFDVEHSFTQQIDQGQTGESFTFKSKLSSGYSKPERSDLEQSNIENWEQLYRVDKQTDPIPSFQSDTDENEEETITFKSGISFSNTESNSSKPTSQKLFQLHNQFIVSQIKSGFMMIDQHQAHQRILFERYIRQIKERRSDTQKLLFPTTLDVQESDAIILKEIITLLNNLGIEIEEFGKNSFVIHGLPVELGSTDPENCIMTLLEQFKNNLDLEIEEYENVAWSLSFQAAIKKGVPLSVEEMQTIVEDLFACDEPYRSPSGRKTYINIDLDDIDKRFT